MNLLLQLQSATQAARRRRADPSIGCAIRHGRVNVVRVTYPTSNGAAVVEPLAGPMSAQEAVSYLDSMQ